MSLRTPAAAALPLAVAALFALAACTAAPDPVASETPGDATPSSTPEPQPSVDPVLEFELPLDCVSMLPESRLAAFTDQRLDLLGGPGGRYGEHYMQDPTPEELAGGITCIWGDETIPESIIAISVAPLEVTSRADIVANLIAQGLNAGELDGAATFSRLGDEISSPAIVNVLREDSWISVIEALGGEAFFEEAVAIAGEVYGQVYTTR